MRDYTKVIAWQKADDLTVGIYEITKAFPKDEIYALTSQIRRAAYSVPANIVEGSGRASQKDYLHFLYIARGSLNETRYFLHLATRLRYLAIADHNHWAAQAEETMRTLSGLIKSVESSAGPLGRTAARTSSWLVLSLAGLIGPSVCSLWSKV